MLQYSVSAALTMCRPWFSVHPSGISTTSFFRRFASSRCRTVVWMYAPGVAHSHEDGGMPYSARIASICASLASQISCFARPTALSSNSGSVG